MSGPTKGPWRVGYRAIDVGCENAKTGGYAKLFDVRGWGYLTGSGHGGLALDAEIAYEIQKANANLIAAAPDLFDACASVWMMLSDTKDNELRLIADECRAAIAKAEGVPLSRPEAVQE